MWAKENKRERGERGRQKKDPIAEVSGLYGNENPGEGSPWAGEV